MQSTIKTVTSVTVMVLMMATSVKSFSQTSKFSISINSLTTNFNYGKSNSILQPYKKDFKGLQAGVSYQAGISPVFSVVPELYWAMKGGTLKANNPLTGGKSTLRLYSVEMPVLARLHVSKLFLNAGPYAGYTFSGRMKIDKSETVPETSTKVSFGNSINDFKRWDFGVLAGAGYNFTIGNTPLTLDARYGYGLTNLSKDVERYNRVLNVSLVVSRPNKKKGADKKG